MEFIAAVFDADAWRQIMANPEPFFTVLSVAVVLAVLGCWLILRMRYQGIIDFQDRKLADYKEIRSLESRLARLEPRGISGQQREILREKLTLRSGNTQPISIVYDMSCPDGSSYAGELINVFETIPGWLPKNGMVGGPAQVSPSGLALTLANPSQVSAIEKQLIASFDEAGIRYSTIHGGHNPDGVPMLLVSRSME